MMRCLALGALLSLAACARPRAVAFGVAGPTMGTTYRVQVVAAETDAPTPEDVQRTVAEVLDGIERRMSHWDPDSELSRFGRDEGTEWFPVGADTATVVAAALDVGRRTGGALDVTLAPLVDLWGFGPGRPARRMRPADGDLERARALVGAQHLEARADPPALRKHVAGLRVDLSAVAKGFAVDEVARLLERRGVESYLVEIGGELRGRGRRADGRPWRIAVERPAGGSPAPSRTLELSAGAVATSGDYRNAFEQDGTRYSHVLDPRTGAPATSGVAEATVLAATALEADAFATALLVLPPDRGLALAAREGLEARLLVRVGAGFVERCTAGFPSSSGPTSSGPSAPHAAAFSAGVLTFLGAFAALAWSRGRAAPGPRACGGCGHRRCESAAERKA